MEYIDFRSDTITRPSPEMRRIMAEAKVGDDVFGDDPTVNELQEFVAQMFGKEAALFVPSGTMANAVSILAHTSRGDEVIVERDAHTFMYEVAGPATMGGVQLLPIPGTQGIITAKQIQKVLRSADDIHVPQSRLICLENTHNRGGGKIYPIEEIKAIHKLAQENGLKMHLDGARLFNAVVATGIKPAEYAQYFDSLMFCFSKGLGAPIGSIIIGSAGFIQQAIRYRKMLGGGMRQVGIIAAAARYVLENNVERLAEDHQNAKLLAQALSENPRFKINPEDAETNIVIFDVEATGKTAAEIVDLLAEKGVLLVPFGKYLVRAVTHLDVSRTQTEKAIGIIKASLK